MDPSQVQPSAGAAPPSPRPVRNEKAPWGMQTPGTVTAAKQGEGWRRLPARRDPDPQTPGQLQDPNLNSSELLSEAPLNLDNRADLNPLTG